MVRMSELGELRAQAQKAVVAGDARSLELALQELDTLPDLGADPLVVADLHRFRGILAMMQGKYTEAIEKYKAALDILEPRNDAAAIARVCNNMGVVYHTLADYPNAVYWYQRTLEAREGIGDISGIARVAANIGIVYSSIGDAEQARRYYERSLELSKQLGDAEGIARGNSIVGNLYVQLGDDATARPYLFDAIEQTRQLGMDREWISAAASLASALYKTHEYERALELISEVEPVASELGLLQERLHLRMIKATSKYQLHGDVSQLDVLTQLLAEIQDHKLAYEEKDLHYQLWELYKHQKNADRALYHHEQWVAVRDRISGEERQRQMILLETEQRLKEERRKTEEHKRLLHNMVPEAIASRLLRGEMEIADAYQNVSVLFTDIVGFTQRAANMPVEELIALLNGLFSRFDDVARKHGVTKVKTIGDAYLAVVGAPEQCDGYTAAVRAASAAMEMLQSARDLNIRMGLHAGPVVAGVIGTERMIWDVWGDAVNVASRMENTSQPGRIQVSEDFARLLSNGASPVLDGTDIVLTATPFRMVMRGTIDVKGKGEMKTFWLEKATTL